MNIAFYLAVFSWAALCAILAWRVIAGRRAAAGLPLPIYNDRNRIWVAFVLWLAPKLIAYSRSKPYEHLEGYMNRHWIFRYSRWTLGWSARIHEILRSDLDRAHHDHPWPYISVILGNGYYEVTPVYSRAGLFQGERRVWYGPGSVLVRKAKHLHRIEVPEGQTATTLFICGPWQQEWGFVRNLVWKTYWKDYLAENEAMNPRFDEPEKRDFLVCSCGRCRGITFAARYDSTEDKLSAKEDFFRLLNEDRNPFVLSLRVNALTDDVTFPEWCKCGPIDESKL